MDIGLSRVYELASRASRIAVIGAIITFGIFDLISFELPLSGQVVIAVIALLIGIPHGAIDHLITIPRESRVRFIAFIIFYILLAVAAGFAIATWNQIGFQLILVISALHFGFGDGALLTSFGSNGSLTLSNSHIHYPLLLFQEKNIYAAGMLSGFPGSVIPVGFSSIKNGAETIIFQGNNSYAYTAGYKDIPVTQPIYIRGKIYVAASVLDAIGPPNVRNPVILSFNENGGLNKDFGTNGSYRNLVPNTGQLYGSMVFTKFKDNQILFASYDGISLVFQSFNLQQKATEPAKLIGSIPYTALNQVMQVGANLFMAHGEAQGLDSSKSVMTVSLISIN